MDHHVYRVMNEMQCRVEEQEGKAKGKGAGGQGKKQGGRRARQKAMGQAGITRLRRRKTGLEACCRTTVAKTRARKEDCTARRRDLRLAAPWPTEYVRERESED